MAKLLGDIAELEFQLRAMQHGFAVSVPIGDSEKYDVIVDSVSG